MAKNQIKLTKTKVDALLADNKDVIYWDTELKGFYLKVTPKGRKVYYAYYRVDGQQRRPSLGVHGQITTAQARELAQQVLAGASLGEDYSQQKQEGRKSITFKEYAEIYMQNEAPKTKRPSSLGTDQLNLNNHLMPAFGSKKLKAISKSDVSRLHSAMKEIPGAANRTFALLSHMMTTAERLGYRPDHSNPCMHIEKYKLQKRERYLSPNELSALSTALQEAEQYKLEMISVINAVRLLIFTGCRMREITTMRWSYIDFENGVLNLPESKTGAKSVYLSAPALEVLGSIKKVKQNPYVIVGRKDGSHLIELRKPWLRIREAATVKLLMNDDRILPLIEEETKRLGVTPSYKELEKSCNANGLDLPVGLTDVRIHDLRHSFASVGVSSGVPLAMIGKLLGHANSVTTEKYAHLANDPVKQANEELGQRLAAMMDGQSGNIVLLNSKKK